jgi:RHS repeat-associated protein
MHEHLDDFGLINMNGRVYDPLMAQFLSPDPYIQAPGSWMNYNRYAYCYNNPLMYNDPSGYKWNWNWLNPVHWLSQGMQWINDNTTMTDIGVPAFNVGYNTSDGSFHSFGNGANIYHNQFDPAVNVNQIINEVRLSKGTIDANISSFGGGDRMPTIDGQTAQWSLEYITERSLEIGSNPIVGQAAYVSDDILSITKGMGHLATVISVGNDTYQFVHKESIDAGRYVYRLSGAGAATYLSLAGSSAAPLVGTSVYFYEKAFDYIRNTTWELQQRFRSFEFWRIQYGY